MKWIITEHHTGMILRSFLLDVARFSNRLIKKAKSADGEILINGEKKTVRYILQLGDLLEIKLPSEQKSDLMKSEEIPLQIVYEDDDLLIINKAAGIATIPSRHHPTGTVANGLLYYYEQNGLPFTIHIVTRLDKDTSGLVLIAKHQYCHSLFSTMQRNNQINRKYIAIIHGKMSEKNSVIDAPIGRKKDSIIERTVTNEGKRAVTYYQIVKETEHFSVVEIELETGRTHQIRVHFSFLGHPLVGDDLYGGRMGIITRQALHCAEISFCHPFTKEQMIISTELPIDMKKIIDN